MLPIPLKPLFTRLLLLILWAMGGLLLAQCAKEEPPLEPLRSDLMMVRTDARAVITDLVTDEGKRLSVTNQLRGVRADTTYRVLATYRPIESSSQVWVRHVVRIPTANPVQLKEQELRDAPVQLLSLWKSKTFLNLRFGIPKSFHGEHTIGWAFRGLLQQADGHRKLQLQLYHNAHADRQDYSQEAYLSCPLEPFSQWLLAGRDSIVVQLNTLKGVHTQTFAY